MWEFRDLEHQQNLEKEELEISHEWLGCDSNPGHALCLQIHPTTGKPWTHNLQTRRAPQGLEHLRIHRVRGYQGRRHSQWDRIESPEINHSVKSDLCLTTHKKSSKWLSDLRVTNKTVKLLGEDLEVNFHSLRLDSRFSDMSPKSQVTKGKQINWNSFSSKNCARNTTTVAVKGRFFLDFQQFQQEAEEMRLLCRPQERVSHFPLLDVALNLSCIPARQECLSIVHLMPTRASATQFRLPADL